MANPVSNIMNSFAEGSIVPKISTSILLGIIFHQSIRSIEFELFIFHFAIASLLIFLSLVFASGLLQATLLFGSFHASLFSSIVIYRLFFHRLHRFPGPFGAKLSRFYALKLSAKHVQYYKESAKMHSQYGDFVRTGRLTLSRAAYALHTDVIYRPS